MSTAAAWRRQLTQGARQRRLPLAVFGDGDWASVTWCPGLVTAYLCASQKQADAAKADMDEHACGGSCIGDHSVERFVPPVGEVSGRPQANGAFNAKQPPT